jgi:LmbE family N-acetylglucosaminyl deacetylase
VSEPLTLMAVHAHPDDEVIGTGGILARYGAAGARTVLVTCTDGRQGDGPGGIKPGDDKHDEEEVVRLRRQELERSCEILGVSHLEMLGYRDSGMEGWDANGRPDAFCNVPLEAAAARVSLLIERYRPQVLVTYDENGAYGHPDHIQAHRVAMAATEQTGIPQKLYYTAIPRSAFRAWAEGMRAAGIDLAELGFPDVPEDEAPAFGTPDELIGAVVDVSGYTDRKREALHAHASQAENFFLLRLPDEAWRMAFSSEYFVRVRTREPVDPAVVEDDLFSGVAG